eukprot:2733193-Rhodomonas_salina.1
MCGVLGFLGCWLPVLVTCLYCGVCCTCSTTCCWQAPRQSCHWAVFADQLVVSGWHTTVSEPALGVGFPHILQHW